MNPVTQCLECGAEIPATAKGLCPKCMLKLGLASQFAEPSIDDAGTRTVVPPPAMPFDFGEYRVLRLLGRGGMGAVYEAEQRESGRRVALKVLGHSLDSPDLRKRFLREGRLAAAINHPNSVYIYGTEEIDATPVIAMELVAGGTLKDEVKRRGPLPVRDAVDAILQIIEGLEAAHAGGILHRDIKPGNCFLAADGTVKVGDFGLSISTLARADSQITASGVMLGTPSFAAPEQLRGEELDVRADIYSVGATLYYLLTGKPPYEGDNVVQVVAAVLDKAPRPITTFRKDVPSGLAQVIGRCLAKQRTGRFAGYAPLREALLPYSSAVPEPAPIALRILAHIIDIFVVSLPALVLAGLSAADFASDILGTRTWTATALWIAWVASHVAYYTIFEGIWGAGAGKALCGLRVIAGERGAPGLARGAVRALVWVLLMNAATIGQLLVTSPETYRRMKEDGDRTFPRGSRTVLILALAFATARRRNGFAGLHELASGTRVVTRTTSQARPDFKGTTTPATNFHESERIGPYEVGPPIAGSWLAGYDDVLRRHVWIRRHEPGTPALPASRRDLGRASRLRWLGGARDSTGDWDAFEAPIGEPLLEVAAQRQPWSAVRYWLLDLAQEIDAAAKDGTLPAESGPDCVWITAQGRAVLLDEPWPSLPPSPRFAGADPIGAQRFLDAVANSALDQEALPLHARAFLRNLAAGALDRISFIVGNLRSLLSKAASVSRWRRLASIAAAPGFVLAAILITFFAATHRLFDLHAIAWSSPPGVSQIPIVIQLYTKARGQEWQYDAARRGFFKMPVQPDPEFADRLEVYIAGHFREFIHSAEFTRHYGVARLSEKERALLRDAVNAHPQISIEQLAAADAAVNKEIERTRATWRRQQQWSSSRFPTLILSCINLMAAVDLLSVAVFGTTAGLRISRLAVVNRAGEPASRLRMIWRTALIWIPGVLVAGAGAWIGALIRSGGSISPVWVGVVSVSAAIFVSGLIWTLVRPGRGPQDVLAGTRVVMR